MSTKKASKKVTPLIFDTYLAVIKNSVGSKLFRNFYARVNGKKMDIMRGGELSCAFYLSSVLSLFKLIKAVHGTVDSTVRDLQELGWKIIRKPKIGGVLVWDKVIYKNGETHKHLGIYIGHNQAISNSSKLGYPVKHHWTFNNVRRVDLILWNQKLKQDLKKTNRI